MNSSFETIMTQINYSTKLPSLCDSFDSVFPVKNHPYLRLLPICNNNCSVH